MEEEGLPKRMFEMGFEPTGRKRVNNYFTLRWVECIKAALDEEYLQMLETSQFSRLMEMGNHTFSVMFVHYLLSRQLITNKKYELWWLFAGKPIRYGVNEFALVTGLNCGSPPNTELCRKRKRGSAKESKRNRNTGKSGGRMWVELFGNGEKPTPSVILEKLLLGKKYKDPLTRFRLALLLLVEGLLCPTSGTMYLDPDVVEMVSDVEAFLQYPWGRKSFLLTVQSAKSRTAAQFVQETTAIQGFPHAMVLVTACCCPDLLRATARGPLPCDTEYTVEELIGVVRKRCLTVNVIIAKSLDQAGQAHVRSLLNSGCDDDREEIRFEDEEEDAEVDHLVALINEDFPFEHNSWHGGVKESEAAEFNVTSPSESEEDDGGEGRDINACTEKAHQKVGEQKRHAVTEKVGSNSASVHECANFEAMVSRVGDEFEDRANGAFARYVNSFKEHVDIVVANLRADIPRLVVDVLQRESISKRTPNVEGINMDDTVVPSEGTSAGTKELKRKAGSNGSSEGRKAVPQKPPVTRVLRPRIGRQPVDINGGRVKRKSIGTSERVGGKEVDTRLESIGCASDSPHNDDDLPICMLLAACARGTGGNDICPVPKPTRERQVNEYNGTRKGDVSPISYTGNGMGSSISTAKFTLCQTHNDVHPTTVADLEVAGGFKPFKQVEENKVREFVKTLEISRSFHIGNALELDTSMVKSLFDAVVVLDEKTVTAIVMGIQKRNGSSGYGKYEFLTPGIIESLRSEFTAFLGAENKMKYNFQIGSRLPQPNRPPLTAAIERLYCPFKVDGHHWVGIIVDSRSWKIFVLDCNTACVSDEQLSDVVAPLSHMIPYVLWRSLGLCNEPEGPLSPLAVARVDIGLLCEVPALSAIVSILLMELHAANHLRHCDTITDANLRTAAMNYAIHVWNTFTNS